MKKILLLAAFLIVIGIIVQSPHFFVPDTIFSLFKTDVDTTDTTVKHAFENKISDIQVGGAGRVIKILPDDTQGHRHQRFIIRLQSGQTLLIAHNIDLAPRINVLEIGDQVEFYGEYEWNAKGGVIHWTHHDPDGSHDGGWLNHDGKLYQ